VSGRRVKTRVPQRRLHKQRQEIHQAIDGKLELSAVFPDKTITIRGLDGDDMLDIARMQVNVTCHLTPLNPRKATSKTGSGSIHFLLMSTP
jgi:hypothetical protein